MELLMLALVVGRSLLVVQQPIQPSVELARRSLMQQHSLAPRDFMQQYFAASTLTERKQLCAIPLTNVLREPPLYPMKVHVPPGGAEFAGGALKFPAPPCETAKK